MENDTKIQRAVDLDIWNQQMDGLSNHLRQLSLELNKWILAALFAANGGGAVAILSTDHIDFIGKKHSGLLFIIGVSISIFYGLVAEKLNSKLDTILKSSRRKIDYDILHNQAFSNERYEDDLIRLRRLTKYAKLADLVPYFALILFVWGATLAGTHMR